MEDTYSALQLISLLEEPVTNDTYDDVLRILSFLGGLKNDGTGGFRPFTGATGLESVSSTYMAFWIYDAFDRFSSINMTTQVRFLNNSFTSDGGFLSCPTSNSSSADVINTYYGLKALELSGNLSLVNMSKVNQFLITCKNAENLFGTTPDANQSSLIATAMAVAIYTEFLPVERPSVITGDVSNSFVSFLTANAGAAGGFYDPSVSSIPLVSLTYYALKTCQLLAVGIPGGNDATVNWILSKQQNDGGFMNGEGGLLETSNMLATRNAVQALVSVSADLSVLNAETPWTLFPVGVIVGIIVIVIAIVAILLVVYLINKRNQL